MALVRDPYVLRPRQPKFKPEISMTSDDFQGYFMRLVENWVNRLHDEGHVFNMKKIYVTAGPWRPYDIRWEVESNILKLDFYSVARYHGISFPDELAVLM